MHIPDAILTVAEPVHGSGIEFKVLEEGVELLGGDGPGHQAFTPGVVGGSGDWGSGEVGGGVSEG